MSLMMNWDDVENNHFFLRALSRISSLSFCWGALLSPDLMKWNRLFFYLTCLFYRVYLLNDSLSSPVFSLLTHYMNYIQSCFFSLSQLWSRYLLMLVVLFVVLWIYLWIKIFVVFFCKSLTVSLQEKRKNN